MNLSKQYLNHSKSQIIFKALKKWRMGGVVPFLIFKYFLSLIFTGII